MPNLEVHALEGDPAIEAGDTIDVRWVKFVRPEMKFEGFEQLTTQIAQDVLDAKAFFRI